MPTGGGGEYSGFLVGAGPPLANPTPPLMATAAFPLIAHCYTNGMVFKGTATVLSKPTFQQNLNAGHQPIKVQVAAPLSFKGVALGVGDVVILTEQDPPTSLYPVFGGIVEDLPDTLSATGTKHEIALTPFVSELGDNHVDLTYTTPVDVAQIVQAAIQQCPHVSGNFYTMVPMTGVKVTGQFKTTVLDCIDQCRKMAGATYWWFVDAIGRFWFQPLGSGPTALQLGAYNGPAGSGYSVTGADFESVSTSSSLSELRNDILVLGGVPTGGSAPVSAEYGPGIQANTSSTIATYGTRRWDPPPTFPGIRDQATITQIANQLGAMFDRVKKTAKLALPLYKYRIVLGQQGGPLLRYLVPSTWPLSESEGGAGTYSAAQVVLEVKADRPEQALTLGDLPYSAAQDYEWEVVRLVQRSSLYPSIYTPAGLNATAAYGSAALATVPDSHAVNRVSFGQLPAITDKHGVASPADTGLRTLDANGNVILDSLGLAQVIGQLATTTGGPSGAITTTTFADVPGASVTIAPSRAVGLLVVAMITASVPTAGGTPKGYVQLRVGGATPAGQAVWGNGVTGVPGTVVAAVAHSSAGSQTVSLQARVDGGSMTLLNWTLVVFQMGG